MEKSDSNIEDFFSWVWEKPNYQIKKSISLGGCPTILVQFRERKKSSKGLDVERA